MEVYKGQGNIYVAVTVTCMATTVVYSNKDL
jgi:hypothetical protein